MEKVKLKIEILKYKITLFTTILAAGVYLLINKKNILDAINDALFYGVVGILLIYGITGYVNNLYKLNEEEKQL